MACSGRLRLGDTDFQSRDGPPDSRNDAPISFQHHSQLAAVVERKAEHLPQLVKVPAFSGRHLLFLVGRQGSNRTPTPTTSFRAKQADFLFRFRSCESVGLRIEESLFPALTCRSLPAASRARLQPRCKLRKINTALSR
jgi:hypothetical protein